MRKLVIGLAIAGIVRSASLAVAKMVRPEGFEPPTS